MVDSLAQAQDSLDAFCVTVGDGRRRGEGTVAELAEGEPLLDLPPMPYPAEGTLVRRVAAKRVGVGVGQPVLGAADGDRKQKLTSVGGSVTTLSMWSRLLGGWWPHIGKFPAARVEWFASPSTPPPWRRSCWGRSPQTFPTNPS